MNELDRLMDLVVDYGIESLRLGSYEARAPYTGLDKWKVADLRDKRMEARARVRRELAALLDRVAASPSDGKTQEAPLQGQPVAKLWLWKNFVDGRPEYWAFDNPYPKNLDNGDPQTLGQPCGYAIFKPSRDGSCGRTEDQVLREMASVASRAVPHAPLLRQAKEALWVCAEHNALHFGENHNTVIQSRAAIAALSAALGEPHGNSQG